MTSRDGKDGQGRPRSIGKQNAKAPKLQHDKNREAPSIGKRNTGERGRRSDAEHFERHAAWERFSNMKNESHAAWEHICCPYGPGWSPQKDPPKTSQTICFKMFLKFFRAPLEHPSCAHQKMDHPKWTPKSSQGNRTKHSFSRRILLILIFGIQVVAAPSMLFILQISKKTFIF